MLVRAAMLAALLVGGCDAAGPTPEPPVPPAPAGEAPTGLRMTTAGPTRIGLAWTDRSDGETAFRVEVATRPFLDRPDGPDVFRTLATLPPGSTAFVDDSLHDVSARLYRVVAVGADQGDDAVSAVLAAAHPVHVYPLARLRGRPVRGAAFPGTFPTRLAVSYEPFGLVVYSLESGAPVLVSERGERVLGVDVTGLSFAIGTDTLTAEGPSVDVSTVSVGSSSPSARYVLALDPSEGCTGVRLDDLIASPNTYPGVYGRCGSRLVQWGNRLPASMISASHVAQPGDRLLGLYLTPVSDVGWIVGQPGVATRAMSVTTGSVTWQREQPALGWSTAPTGWLDLYLEAVAEGVDVVDANSGGALVERIALPPLPNRRVAATGQVIAIEVSKAPAMIVVGDLLHPSNRVLIPLRGEGSLTIRYRVLYEFVGSEGEPALWVRRLDEPWQTVALP